MCVIRGYIMFVRQKKAIVFFVFVLAMLLPVQLASADFYYEDDIDIMDDQISITITDVYTAGHAYSYRMEISGADEMVDENDYTQYMDFAKNSLDIFLKEYVVVDDKEPKLANVKVESPNALGEVSNESLEVTRHVVYELSDTLDDGEHVVKIIGNPDIRERRIVLPKGATLESAEGLKEMQQTEVDGRIVLTGASTTSKYMNGTIQTFEYVTIVTFSKKPWYFNRLVIPILMFMEGLLAIAAIYSLKGKLIKSPNKGNI